MEEKTRKESEKMTEENVVEKDSEKNAVNAVRQRSAGFRKKP